MIKIIELVEKVNNGDGTLSLIAECNAYDNDILVIQFSRSPFTFADTMTDQDIIDYLIANDYSLYF